MLVAQRRGLAPNDLTTDLSVRARVGYGGGEFTVGLTRLEMKPSRYQSFKSKKSGRVIRYVKRSCMGI